jgi:hypothetical protein
MWFARVRTTGSSDGLRRCREGGARTTLEACGNCQLACKVSTDSSATPDHRQVRWPNAPRQACWRCCLAASPSPCSNGQRLFGTVPYRYCLNVLNKVSVVCLKIMGQIAIRGSGQHVTAAPPPPRKGNGGCYPATGCSRMGLALSSATEPSLSEPTAQAGTGSSRATGTD